MFGRSLFAKAHPAATSPSSPHTHACAFGDPGRLQPPATHRSTCCTGDIRTLLLVRVLRGWEGGQLLLLLLPGGDGNPPDQHHGKAADVQVRALLPVAASTCQVSRAQAMRVVQYLCCPGPGRLCRWSTRRRGAQGCLGPTHETPTRRWLCACRLAIPAVI